MTLYTKDGRLIKTVAGSANGAGHTGAMQHHTMQQQGQPVQLERQKQKQEKEKDPKK